MRLRSRSGVVHLDVILGLRTLLKAAMQNQLRMWCGCLMVSFLVCESTLISFGSGQEAYRSSYPQWRPRRRVLIESNHGPSLNAARS
jgi:hypothetical protein